MMVAAVEVEPGRRTGRVWQVDALRGLAIALMVADHVALLFLADFGGDFYRLTLGRVSMPLFFVIAGHLAGRLSMRHLAIGWIGLGLPVIIPWIDSPNVLLIWALGCVVLVGLRRVGLSPAWLVLLALAASANGWATSWNGSYDVLALWALMGAGALLSRSVLVDLGDRLPRWLAVVGSAPMRWYVGHLVVLHLLALGVAAL